jgi:hypothetical protein
MSSVARSPPEQGQLVSVRSRLWLVNDVRPSTLPAPALKPAFSSRQHLLILASAEDDGLGEELQVIWEIEPGASVIEKVALPEPTGFDPPDNLDAFLDAPSAPDKTRQMAVEKAEAGEEITVATAKEIVDEAKKKRRPRRRKAVPAYKLGVRLIKTLRRYQERWPGELSELARHLREFADAVDMRGKKKARG